MFSHTAGPLLTHVRAGAGHPDSGAVQDAESVGFLGQRPIIGRSRSEAQLVVRLNQPLPSLVLQMRWILTLRHRNGRTPSNGSHHQRGVSVGNAGLGGEERAFPGIPITLGRRRCSAGLALRLQRRPNQFRLRMAKSICPVGEAFNALPVKALSFRSCYRGGNAFPRRNCLDDDSKACQSAFDFTLHTIGLRL